MTVHYSVSVEVSMIPPTGARNARFTILFTVYAKHLDVRKWQFKSTNNPNVSG
jgi:hypothetical protein